MMPSPSPSPLLGGTAAYMADQMDIAPLMIESLTLDGHLFNQVRGSQTKYGYGVHVGGSSELLVAVFGAPFHMRRDPFALVIINAGFAENNIRRFKRY